MPIYPYGHCSSGTPEHLEQFASDSGVVESRDSMRARSVTGLASVVGAARTGCWMRHVDRMSASIGILALSIGLAEG